MFHVCDRPGAVSRREIPDLIGVRVIVIKRDDPYGCISTIVVPCNSGEVYSSVSHEGLTHTPTTNLLNTVMPLRKLKPFYRRMQRLCRYPSKETFQGSWTAETESTAVVIMVFDNSYSCLRPKTLAYKVGFDISAVP